MTPQANENAVLAATLAQCEAGDFPKAIALLRDALRAEPDRATYHFQLGNLYLQVEDVAQAEACFREAVRLDPKIPEVPLRMGIECARNGMLDDAENFLRLTLGFGRNNAFALACLGDVVRRQGRVSEALELLQAAPESFEVLLNLGIALNDADRLEESATMLERALRLNPADARLRNNLGVTLKHLGRLEEAIAHLNEALRFAPDFAEARLNRGMLLLLMGDFEQGWIDYESRPKRHGQGNLRADSAAEGRTILLRAEQGLGDLIQFVRYASWLDRRGARVLVECSASMHELIRRVPGVSGVITREAPPDFDFEANLLSMPGVAHPREGFLATDGPYVRADPERVAFWKHRLPEDGRIRVGLVWAGSANNPNDRRRSMPAADLEPIVRHPRVAAYSLQVGAQLPGATSLETGAPNPMETAAMMMCLDLIVSVDTMPAHLASALGRPTWVLLPFVPDWRWGMKGKETPWYPSARLFRQPRPGDWKGVIERVVHALH